MLAKIVQSCKIGYCFTCCIEAENGRWISLQILLDAWCNCKFVVSITFKTLLKICRFVTSRKLSYPRLLGLWSLGQGMRFYRVNSSSHEICMWNAFKTEDNKMSWMCRIQSIRFQPKLISHFETDTKHWWKIGLCNFDQKSCRNQFCLDFGQHHSDLIHFWTKGHLYA